MSTDFKVTLGQCIDELMKDTSLIFEGEGSIYYLCMNNGCISWKYKDKNFCEKANFIQSDFQRLYRVKLKHHVFVGYTSGFIEKGKKKFPEISLLNIEDLKELKTKKNDLKIEITIKQLEES